MRVIGLDPGTARTGYGALEIQHGKARVLTYGVISTPADMDMPARLLQIHQELKALLTEIQPDAVAIEQIFYHKNSKTVISVAQSRGVALMTVAGTGVAIAEYTPLQVKQAVVGYGNADKKQVQYMVQKVLAMQEIPKPDDAADALAAAICHMHFYRLAKYR